MLKTDRIHLAYKSNRDRVNETHPAIYEGSCAHPVGTVALSVGPDQLNHGHLHKLVHRVDRLGRVQQVLDSAVVRHVAERDESVTLACNVGFLCDEVLELQI